MWFEFKGNIAYLILHAIVVEDGYSQRINEAFMAKMYMMWFWQHPGSVGQELMTKSNSAYLD